MWIVQCAYSPFMYRAGLSIMDQTVFFQSIGLSSCFIEAYGSSGKYCWCVSCWLSIYSMKAPFFVTGASWQRQSEKQALGMYFTASWSYSVAMNGRRASRLTSQIESLAGSSLANMAAKPPESRISPTIAGWSWRCGPALNLPKNVSFGPRGPHAVP